MSGSSVPGGTRGSSSFLSSQAAFWLAWFSTCFTHDADKLCAPAGLTLLSALLLLLSCFLVLYLRCQFPGEYSGETLLVLYCFLGDLCSAMGAIMSRQLHIQVFMGSFAAVLDAFSCVLCCFPVFLCWNSEAHRRLRMAKRRRRQHLLAVGVLMVVAGGFLKSRVTEPPSFRSVRGRKLLHSGLQPPSWSLLMDNSEILGYTLGLLSFVIACTSRFPALCRATKGQKFTRSYIFSRLLCSVSGALYTAAILLYNTQFGFLLRVLPWLLSATSCVLLDLIILVIYSCKRATRQRRMKFGPDMESLLGGSGISAEHTGVSNQQKKPSSNISDQTKVFTNVLDCIRQYSTFPVKMKNIQKRTEMGQYMDVRIHPAKQISLKEAMMGKERVEGGALCSRVRLVRAGSLCSSDTSYDSSADSSDLEWDFGAAISQWSKPAVKLQQGDEFPLQDWPANPKPLSICTCAEPPKKTLCASEECSPAVI
ncbi:transmembrane protein 44 isoform X1 [Oryzias melastigma]|uniref:transmembrane protein 44 isoform X1 n=1 Tax=Oryzias melastigma TaxID=30732 RepID=UPI000CF7E7CD|nr:transmembrane protein 44 isoform X1 [Oryzias melastigma]